MLHALRYLTLPFLLIASLFHSQQTAYTHLIDHVSASIVRITGEKDADTMFGPQHFNYTCSGEVIAPHRVLTAAHCVGDKVQADGLVAYLLKQDNYDDLALYAADTGKPVLPIAWEPPTRYSHLTAIGYAFGFSRLSALDQKLILVDYAPSPELAPGLLFTPGLVGGMSGGPIVDESGIMVAINQRGAEHLGYGVGVVIIRAFLVGTDTL